MQEGKKEPDFLIAILNNSGSHITFMKKQQWTITYYCLLVYGVVIGLCRLFQFKLENWERIILGLVSFVVCVVGYWLVLLFGTSISEHRQITSKIYKYYRLECEKVGINPDETVRKDTGIFVTLLATIIAGLLAVMWVFYRTRATL